MNEERKSPEQFEEKIREQRLIEATKRGYTGKNGKLHLILFTLGEPIVAMSEGGATVDSHYLDDPYAEGWPDESLESARTAEQLRDRIQTMYMEYGPGLPMGDGEGIHFSQNTIGFHFDGLSRGMHLEIKYDNLDNEITVRYKGYLVYQERKGELRAYHPLEEWEGWIDRLFKAAKQRSGWKKEEEFQQDVERAEREKENWWQSLRRRWGI
jgi:hypothetical protein